MATPPQAGTPFPVYLLIITDTVGNTTTTVYSNRPTSARASTSITNLRTPVIDQSSITVQQAEAVLLTDGTTRVLGITCTLHSAPIPSDSTLLAAFRASLAGDASAQATFDTVSARLP